MFDSLFGCWQLKRVYTSHLTDYPSGSSTGTANFELRNDSGDALEYLYKEQTEFTPPQRPNN
ncbi:DUF6314 domain-containing protein [Aphelenchoides bicaudatus]|nr:DUF6314 domain-containing protein [Aphelenchoides bicaudatus]